MKIKLILTMMFLTLGSLLGGEKFETLTTKDGKTYTKVEVTNKTPANISIIHEGGMARIPFQNLDDSTIKILGGYDPKLAKKFSKEEEEKLAKMEASLNAELAKMKKSGKTDKEGLSEYTKRIERDKTIHPKEKAERLRLVRKKLDTLKLESAKGIR